jgi:hypothetical protein
MGEVLAIRSDTRIHADALPVLGRGGGGARSAFRGRGTTVVVGARRLRKAHRSPGEFPCSAGLTRRVRVVRRGASAWADRLGRVR